MSEQTEEERSRCIHELRTGSTLEIMSLYTFTVIVHLL